MNILVTFRTVTVLCNHHTHVIPARSITSKGNPAPIQRPLLIPPPPAPGNHQSTFCLHGFACSGSFT